MFRLNKDRCPKDIPQAPVYSRGPQLYKTTAVSVPRQGRSKSWVRPQSAEKAPASTQPVQAVVPGADLSSSNSQSFLSVSRIETRTQIPPSLLQKGLYISRKKNTLTRVAPSAPSNSSTEGQPVSGTTSQIGRNTRRLIHQGRHKLVQSKSGQHTQRLSNLHSSQTAQTPTALQQYRRFVSAQNRKRAGPALAAPASKKAHKWVRDAVTANLLPHPESKRGIVPSSVSYVRSSKTHKLQLLRRRSASSVTPATPVSRLQSRGSVLAKQLLSVRSLKRTTRPSLKVNASGVSKPGKLQRMGGVLYKVGDSKHGRSLQRQVTPKSIRPLLSPEVSHVCSDILVITCCVLVIEVSTSSNLWLLLYTYGIIQGYVRQGRHLMLKSTLKSPRIAARRVTSARSSSAAAAVKAATRQKLVARARKPNSLRRSSQSAQTHCLVYCRSGCALYL